MDIKKELEQEAEVVKTNLMACVKDKLRTAHWFVLAVLCFMAAFFVDAAGGKQLSTIFWKAGLVTVAVTVGYWADRNLYKDDRVGADATDMRKLCRAVVVLAVIYGFCSGM